MIKSAKKIAPQSAAARPITAAATAILDVSEQFAQTRGYNGFSYADVATQLGVTKASLHYHFPSKAHLGAALIERYQHTFGAALETIDGRTDDPAEKLRRYIDLYDSRCCAAIGCACAECSQPYTRHSRLHAGAPHIIFRCERALAHGGAAEWRSAALIRVHGAAECACSRPSRRSGRRDARRALLRRSASLSGRREFPLGGSRSRRKLGAKGGQSEALLGSRPPGSRVGLALVRSHS